MDGRKAIGKTIGEVEKLTGIPKRELKYYTEQGLIQPSQKSESGYWLYSREDIQRVQLAALCRELDFPARILRAILTDPAHCWQRELEQHITRLNAKRTQIEIQLSRAEALRLHWEAEEWASLITNATPAPK